MNNINQQEPFTNTQLVNLVGQCWSV